MKKMASMKRPRLKAVAPLTNFRLRLTFIDGSVFTIDFKPLFEESPGLVPLRNTKAFAGAALSDQEGWSVE